MSGVTGYSLFGTSQSTVLFALDRATGAVAWEAPLAVSSGTPTPSVGDGRVFVVVGTTLQAFAADGTGCTGTPLACEPVWSAVLAGTSTGPPTISRHRVFVTAAGTLASFATDSGAPLWSAQPGATLGVPSIAAGVLFVGSGDGRLLAYDATGTVNCAGSPTVCSPVWSGDLPLHAGVGRPVPTSTGVYISSADATSSQVTKFVF